MLGDAFLTLKIYNMKLISMTDFVIAKAESKTVKLSKLLDYAKFLKQPLTLGMFVPCDDDGNVLEKPELSKLFWEKGKVSKECEAYQQAQSKVIFEGFYLDETYKREKRQLPYLTNGKISVFLHADFAIRHQFIEDLVDFDLDLVISF